jgi:RimJ/RimL family protein N-acetyltransferase
MTLVTLRAFPEDALIAIARWRTDSEVNKHIRRGNKTLAEVRDWYHGYFSSETNRLLAVYRDNELVGYCTIERINAIDMNCEVGILTGERQYWRQGIGSAALGELLRIVFGELRLHRVEAVIHADNISSVSCFSRAGFRLDGTLREAKRRDGRFVDLLLYSMLAHEWEGTTAP